MVLDPRFFNSIKLGTILSFRYVSPGANDRTPLVLVIAPEYQGKLHGLNLRYLRAPEVEQLQWVFKAPQQQRLVMNPFVQEEFSKAQKQAKEEAEARRQEYLQKQQGVIVKPASDNPFGVSTFGPSRTNIMQAQQGMPGISPPPTEKFQQEVMNEQQRQKHERMRQLTQRINQNKALLSHPYNFYHSYVKPILGPNIYNIAKAYRKYFWRFIQNPRIVQNLAYGTMVTQR